MKLFMPDRVYIDPKSLEYDTGIMVKEKLETLNIPIIQTKSCNRR